MSEDYSRKRRKQRRLSKLRIDEISWVDHPANQERFMFIKQAVDKAGPVSLDIKFSTEGKPATTKLTVNGKPINDPTSFMLEFLPLNEDHISLRCAYSVDAKNESNGGFNSSRYYSLSKRAGAFGGEVQWDDEYVKGLPDESFLYKTEDQRLFPVRNSEGELVPGRLVAVEKDIDTGDLQDDVKQDLQTKLSVLWGQVASESGAPEPADMVVLKSLEPDINENIDAALASALASQAKVVADYADDMPADLVDAVRTIVKLATEGAEDDNQELSVSENTEAQAAPVIDTQAIADQAATKALAALEAANKAKIEAEAKATAERDRVRTEYLEELRSQGKLKDAPEGSTETTGQTAEETSDDDEYVEVTDEELAAQALKEVAEETASTTT